MISKKLDERKAFEILKRYKIPVAKRILAKSPEEAGRAAKKIGFPVVMKIYSPDIIHKTDAGGVVLGIKTEQEAKRAYSEIIKKVRKKVRGAKILGVFVEETAEGHELIIGSRQDAQFGPVIMFGLGGIFVEVFKDVVFRIIPIERKDASEMIREIKGYKILEGSRGKGPINFKALENCLLNVSKMIWANRKKIKELDINPVFANEKGVKAVDVRIIV